MALQDRHQLRSVGRKPRSLRKSSMLRSVAHANLCRRTLPTTESGYRAMAPCTFAKRGALKPPATPRGLTNPRSITTDHCSFLRISRKWSESKTGASIAYDDVYLVVLTISDSLHAERDWQGIGLAPHPSIRKQHMPVIKHTHYIPRTAG